MKKGTKVWLDFADRDLQAARLLVDREYVSNVVLFHAQQCVEKCLKALLEENGVLVPHIHSVVKLNSLVMEEAGISLNLDEDELDLVDAVYIDTRYPSGLGLLPFGFPSLSPDLKRKRSSNPARNRMLPLLCLPRLPCLSKMPQRGAP
jgi:HEPN domain-containing protein